MTDQATFVYRRPKWGRGMITGDDARFLHDLVLDVRPQVAVEIGVASGCSSVAILDAMSRCRDRDDDTWLYAFDVSERCYFDTSKPTGAAVSELTPWHTPRYRFTVGDVLHARAMLTGLGASFAFIDGNHLHPWATANLLGVLQVLAPGAWVAVHDIRLPLLERRKGSRGHGPRHLFETWPGEKRQGGSDDNIGAIRLPANLDAVRAVLRASLARPWEVALPDAVTSALRIEPRPVQVMEKGQALRTLARAVGRARPLYVCGTGQAGRALARELLRRELPVAAFADRDPVEHGSMLDGLPVEARDGLSPEWRPRPFMAVSGVFATGIDAELTSRGWVRGEDFVVF